MAATPIQIFDHIKGKAMGALRGKTGIDKFIKMWEAEENKSALEDFVLEPSCKLLFIHQAGDKLITATTPPDVLEKNGLYFVKSKSLNDQVDLPHFQDKITIGTVNGQQMLDVLSLTASEVYFPLLSNPANRQGWSGPTSKEVMLKLSNFLSNVTMAVGQSKGQTLLPYPPPEAFDEDNLPEQEREYLLETSVVQWTKKIEGVLETDPDHAIKQGRYPDGLAEIEFWKAKAQDLNSLLDQLTSDKMNAVLETLKQMNSFFAAQFTTITEKVSAARIEAQSNRDFLGTLEKYFIRLETEMEFSTLDNVFFPMMHNVLLIWTHAPYYKSKERMSTLIQEICNALVKKGSAVVSGATIFRFIEDENVPEAQSLLKAAIKTCNAFKNSVARYQHKAKTAFDGDAEKLEAWAMNEEVVYQRLELFLERCHDISDFLLIHKEFNKLEKVCLGGTKGHELSDQVVGIHQDFVAAVGKFQAVPYDCMDITVARFDADFYQYRVDIKELERRLATVIIEAFEDSSSLKGIFKLLDNFGEGLIERPIIQDEINKKHAQMLAMYMEDLNTVQAIFSTHKNDPAIDNNMPPIAGALSWSRGLLDRIQEPLSQLRHLTAGSEREQVREVEKVSEAIAQKLAEYEKQKIVEWTEEVDQSSQSKLMQALLRRDKESRRLDVNFDDDLVRLLREVKYFLLLGQEVPPKALSIYEKGEYFRTQIGNLELISQMYNEMMETLHVVERPLVEKEMAHIDETIERGISELNWNSPEVEAFITESMTTVKVVYSTVKTMKENFKTVKKIMAEYAKVPLAERKSKPLAPSDFEENMKKLWDTRHKLVAQHQETVTKLLGETNDALSVNKGSPIWRAYVEYVQDHVRDGLALTIVNSIKFICDQLDQTQIEKNNLAPLLEIKLGLYANDVMFNAEVAPAPADDKAPRKSPRLVWQIINDWVEGFFEIGNIMTRMDGSHYVGDMKKNEGIVRVINNLKKHLDWNQKECENYRNEYTKFDFLWKADRNVEFTRFLAQAQKKTVKAKEEGEKKKEDDEDGDEDDHDAHKGKQGDMILPLDKFEEKILYYKDLQAEIEVKKSPVDIGWLKVNAQPIKVSLNNWISRWISTYTTYLYNDVSRKLSNLESMMNDVDVGLKQEVRKGDSDALKAVLGHIHMVRSHEKSTVKMFQPLRDTASLLKKFGKPLEEYEMKLLSDAPMKWDATVNNVYKVKEKVNNLQNEEVDKIKDKVSNFDYLLIEFRKKFRKEAPFAYERTVKGAYQQIDSFHKQIGSIEEEAAKLVDLERVFELSVSKHREIKKCRAENKLLKQCWDMVSIVRHLFESWKKTLWDKIDTDSLLMDCKKLQRQINMMPKEMRSWKVYQGLLGEVKNFSTVLPLVNLLHSPCMEQRHWADLKKATGRSFEKTPSFNLSNLLDLELHLFVADVESIVELATKESKIESQLDKIDQAWSGLEMEFGVHAKKGEEIPTIRQPEETLIQLEENMAALQGMSGQGRYVEYFIDRVTRWQKDLGNTETVLITWLDVQRNWSALEAIYLGSQDIRVQLPEDSRRFDEIDEKFRTLMSQATKTPNVIESCSVPGRREMLLKMATGLEQCEKSLFQYLETKRKAFPRFYFVANAALLDILSNGYNPQAIQKHLGDCFEGIANLKYLKDDQDKFTTTAVGYNSKVGAEYVDFHENFTAEGAVEDWLNKLVRWMRDSLKDVLKRAKHTADLWEVEAPRPVWVYDYPAQVALTASQIIWTEEVGNQFDAFADGNEQAMKDYVKVLDQRLNSFINLVLGKLSKCDRVKVITLITVDVHNRDTVQKLIDEKVSEANAFTWQSQLRFTWNSEANLCVVKIADASFDYSYEYVGNTGRLVITPLTDRCYITLTQALRLIMGGAPAGPAGTGKTETVKDLGRALGQPVYVFNGSEQMNVTSMSAVFKGLVQTGAWGCFDEFNRIPIEVLSVVSTQFGCILQGIRAGVKVLDFLGEMIPLVTSIGCFITMNPGYAGRTELPENLKSLFRSCAMVVPDLELICENMLMAEGFVGARRLAKKFTTLYSLSKELLSKQIHYDWGLRATKAVLRVAGGLKRAEPDVAEDRILLRALRDFNIPKLVDDDKPIFLQLISDLFPGLGNTQRKVDEELKEVLQKVAVGSGLQAEDMFISKCIELAELLVIRHSVFIIGPPGAAKSRCWQNLAAAFNDQGIVTVSETLNPKAIRNNELYGWLSKTDWNDGVLSTLMRNMSRENHPFSAKQKNKWIILDGDIDPEWIESLNTVMDDNKVLTLVSNERIPVTDSMRLILETGNLDNATPATVSRAGILFINARDVGFKPFLDSWIESRENDNEKSSLLSLFLKYTTPEYVTEMCKTFERVVPVSEISMIKTLCRLLEGLLERMEKARKERARREEKMDAATEKELFETSFVFACIWAFGGACSVDKNKDCKKEFSEWWKRVFPNVKFPKEGTVFDYFVHPDTGKFVHWDEVVKPYDASDDAYLVTRAFVPISETVRLNFMMDLLVLHQYPMMVCGNGGTGKTVVVNRYVKDLCASNDQYMSSTVNLNYYTDAKAIQVILEGPIDKRSGRIFGPPGTKKLIYFVDDLNMPSVDAYGTQSPSCLIRQHVDYSSWYDTVKLEKKIVKDVQFLASMNPTAGSFTINPRLQGQFATFSSQIPSATSLTSIYTQVLEHHFSAFSKSIQDMAGNLVAATIELHDSVSMRFLPSSRTFHYLFTLRDISSIFQGVCMSQAKVGFDEVKMTQLWLHECQRVFADRLVSPEDEAELVKLLNTKSKKFFNGTMPNFETKSEDGKKGEDIPNVFTSFIAAEPAYLPVTSMTQLKTEVVKKLDEYNDLNPVMDLELFGMAVGHVARICRIIENPYGNALLVGVGGSGKQSLARLAAFICGFDIFQISVSSNYGVNDLKQDLQDLYIKTGVKSFPVMFMMTDLQILDDTWLVYVNDLLSSGYIPALFADEDLDGIFSSIRNEAKAQGISEQRGDMMDFFISRVRSNLHMCLCMSPVGEVFRVRCRKFPGLINCTSIDWFHPWPEDALVSVAYRFLGDLEDIDDQREMLSKHMALVHLSVNKESKKYLTEERRYNYTTPKSYLELIDFYKTLLTDKRTDLEKQTSRLEKGITTIVATKKDVDLLKEELQKTLVRVAEKTEATTELIEKMGVERKKVEEQQAIANVEATKAKSVASTATLISEECKRDLAAALPIMEKAKAAVECLDKNSLTTLKSFSQPPGNVIFVTNAAMIMLGVKAKLDWAGAKKMMKEIPTFLANLKSYDATKMSDDIVKKVTPIIKQPFFNADAMKNSSEAAANLCEWVVNICQYNEIYKNVAPKIAAKERAEGELAEANGILKGAEEMVAAMQVKLKKATDALKEATDDKNKVEAEAENCKNRLSLANRLVNGLASEGTRWGLTIDGLKAREATLIGDVMLAAAFVSYVGGFNSKYRRSLWEAQWLPDLVGKEIPITEGVDPLYVLANDADFAKWKNEGLSPDRISLENGAILTRCKRWPLMIDPQLQGVKWIRQRCPDLKVINLGSNKWIRPMTLALSMGQTVLIESLGEDIDATLDPVMSRMISKRGHEKIIKLGSEEVSFDDGFQLYLQTKLANPHYRPEIAAQSTLLNFIVTEEGLEDQLLAQVVNKEKPELEEKRTDLVRSINNYMVSLQDLENELLQKLSDAPDDILSDLALIEGLEKTKIASSEIQVKVAEAKKAEITINKARNEFRDVAAEASWLYFLLIQLCVIDHMYQFSLDAFQVFFHKAIERAEPSDDVKQRVMNLRKCIRLTIFTYATRGLFEKHKLIFSSQLTFKLIQKQALHEKVDPAHFEFLIRGPKKAGIEKTLEFLPLATWQNLCALVKLDGFQKLIMDMEASPNRFKEWYNKTRPETSPLPLEWRKLDDNNPFMKMMVVRAMRMDRMTTTMTSYIEATLPEGRKFTECDAGQSFLDILDVSLKDSSTISPLFFILSAGTDPVGACVTIAKRLDMFKNRFQRVALGQGQDIIAMNALELGHKEGHWVVLENIHLMPKWCKELEKKLDEYAATGSHPDFRVFLSAEPSAAIPIGLLERSIKLTNEPPQGLKQNLKKAFASFPKDDFEYRDPKVKSIMFGLCHFHSIILERCKFGPQGWNRPYPFNTGDLMNSATVLQNYLEQSTDKVPWKDLRYIFGEILYGGHITDDLDRLLCNTYLEFYMKEELLDEMELFPYNEASEEKFQSPPVLPYEQYFEYIDAAVEQESPVAFGMHPNAEIAVKTTEGNTLFMAIIELQPRTGGGDGESATPAQKVQMTLEQIVESVKGISYNLDDIIASVVDDRGPYQNVFIMECDRMNILVKEIVRSLKELELGLSGELQMSEKMEVLMGALFLGKVPESWAKMAYPSMLPLGAWTDNLVERAGQLTGWTEEPMNIPMVTQLSYCFNPQSFLTAIMQVTAQRQKLELNKLVIFTEVTRKTVDQTESRSREGAYVSGLYLEGAAWNTSAGAMVECNPRQMFVELPVTTCRAIMRDKMEKTGVYMCPVYKTQTRGPTFVFFASLRTKMPPSKWILAGAAIVLEISSS